MVPTPPEYVERKVCEERHRGNGRLLTVPNGLIATLVTVMLAALCAVAMAWNRAADVSTIVDTHMQVQEEKDRHHAETLDRIEKQVEKILLKMGGP